MPLVKAQCINCDGLLEVDPSQEAAVCPHCGTPYIVEKAINNYNISNHYHIDNANITISGMDKETEWKKALGHLKLLDIRTAGDIFSNLAHNYPDFWGGWYGSALINCQWKNPEFQKCLKYAVDTSEGEIRDELLKISELYYKQLSDSNNLRNQKSVVSNNLFLAEEEHRSIMNHLNDVMNAVCFFAQKLNYSLKTYDPSLIRLSDIPDCPKNNYYLIIIPALGFCLSILGLVFDSIIHTISLLLIFVFLPWLVIVLLQNEKYTMRPKLSKAVCELKKCIYDRDNFRSHIEELRRIDNSLVSQIIELEKSNPNLMDFHTVYMAPLVRDFD